VTSERYGRELILDLGGCNVEHFTAGMIEAYCVLLCERINMRRCGFHCAISEPSDETEGNPKTHGVSAVQFLYASSITVHALDLLGQLFVNVFSCDEFDPAEVERFTIDWFGAQTCRSVNTARYCQ
jgi:S-adenosylmethionine/arginine decarboxylase-like enzyme